MTTRDSILATKPIAADRVSAVATEFGTFHVRVMTGTERDSYDAEAYANFDEESGEWVRPANLRAMLLVRTICDESGVRQFADEEIGLVGDCDHRLLTALYRKAIAINGLGADAVESEKKD